MYSYPAAKDDGNARRITIILTDQGGDIINNALGLTWSHVLIYLDNDWIYEATWPRVRKTHPWSGKALAKATKIEHFELFVTAQQWKGMIEYAESQLGKRYNFWGYFFPRWYNRTNGVYCSQFVCQVLRAGGLNIPIGAGYSPDKLLKTLKVCDL